MSDAEYMGLALALAKAAAEGGETPVGCVIVDEATGEVLARAANGPIGMTDPTAHAEILALRGAAEATGNYRLRPNLTLYVTLEPCAMCAGAIVNARVGRLVFGALDAKAGAVASVFDIVRDPRLNHRVEVVSGVHADECAAVLREFFAGHR